METSVVRSGAAEHLSMCLSLLDFKLIMYLSVLLGQVWLKNREIPVIMLMDEVFVSCSSFVKGCARVLWTRRLLADLSSVQIEPVSPGFPGHSAALPSPLGAGVLHVAFQGGLGSVERGVMGENPPGAELNDVERSRWGGLQKKLQESGEEREAGKAPQTWSSS